MKNKKTLLWIWHNAKFETGHILILSFISILTSSFYIVPALLSRHAINAAVEGGSLAAAKHTILLCALALLGVILVQLLFYILSSHLRVVIEGKLEMRFRRNFFETVTKKDFSSISRFHSGEILNRYTSDIDVVVSGITTFIPQALSIFAKLISGLIVLASFSAKFTFIALCIGAFVLLCTLLFKPYYKKMHKAVQSANGEARSFTQECFENIVVVKSFLSRLPLLSRLDTYNQKIYNLKISRNHINNVASGGISLIFTLGYYGTLIWGTLMIASGSMDYGTLTAFLQIVSQIQSPFLNASGLITQYYSAQASAERLMEIESYPDDPPMLLSADLYEKITDFCAAGLSFRYTQKKRVIERGDFAVSKGSMVAITGASGTGKSTLFKLFLGLFTPDAGRLYLKTSEDDIPINASARSLFAYVPQGNLLLSGTIAENIKFANPELSDKQMIEAAKTACIYDAIMALPDGFQTEIRERGAGLSEGQIQRISVARALCCGAPVLLLDECTSALDSTTEEQLLRNLAALPGKTVFFISHRNAAFSFCDKHLVLSDGILTEASV